MFQHKRHKRQAAHSIHYDIAGYGIGGRTDALRLQAVATRAAEAAFDNLELRT